MLQEALNLHGILELSEVIAPRKCALTSRIELGDNVDILSRSDLLHPQQTFASCITNIPATCQINHNGPLFPLPSTVLHVSSPFWPAMSDSSREIILAYLIIE